MHDAPCEQCKLTKVEDCAKLLARFANLKLEDKAEDPINLFLEMEHINHIMEKIDKKCKKQEIEMIIMLFLKLPKLCSEIIAIKMRNILTLTWINVKQSMRELHARNCPQENDNSKIAPLKNTNQTLTTTNQSMTSFSQNARKGNRGWKNG